MKFPSAGALVTIIAEDEPKITHKTIALDPPSVLGLISFPFSSLFLENVYVARRELMAMNSDASPKCNPGHILSMGHPRQLID